MLKRTKTSATEHFPTIRYDPNAANTRTRTSVAAGDASSRDISCHDSASDKDALDLLAFPSGRQPGQRGLSASVGFSVLWPRGRGSPPAQRSDTGTDHRAGRPADAGREVAGRERTVAATAEAVTTGGGGPGTRSGGVVRVR